MIEILKEADLRIDREICDNYLNCEECPLASYKCYKISDLINKLKKLKEERSNE